jgi:ATP-dependent DNA helicase DinG
MDRKNLLKKLNLSDFVALDFETTGIDSVNDRIIEVAAIRFTDGKASNKFVKLVNPGRPIPDFITNITNISNEMVKDAQLEEEIVEELTKFIGDSPIIAHNTTFDIAFLQELTKRHNINFTEPDLYDSLPLARTFLYHLPAFNLGVVSEYYGLSAEGSHRAEKDTENCGIIFLNLIEEAASYPLHVISKILELLKNTELNNKTLFINIANQLTKSGEIKKGLTKSKENHIVQDNVYFHAGKQSVSLNAEDVLGEGGILNKVLVGYEKRSQQIEYSNFIDDIINGEAQIGVVEAGTGLGKSFAYLFPALKRTEQFTENGPVIISCYTKNLQDQLFYKDLPVIADALDISVKAVKLKGRNNYICLTRLNWLIADASRTLNEREIEKILPLLVWLEWTNTGDLSECNGFWNSRPGKIAFLIQSEPGFCTTKLCARNNGCFFGRVRRDLYEASIIIVNHALLLSEITMPGFLPMFNTVIIDEAHNLVPVAYKQLSHEMDQIGYASYLQSIDPKYRGNKRWNNMLSAIGGLHPEFIALQKALSEAVAFALETLKSFFEKYSINVDAEFNKDSIYTQKKIISKLEEEYISTADELEQLVDALKQLHNNIEKIANTLFGKDPERKDYDELHQVLDQQKDILSGLINNVILLTSEQNPENVYWKEGDFNERHGNKELKLSLHASPVDVSEKLNSLFFNNITHCILTSATLRVNSEFDYYFRRTGLDRIIDKSVKTDFFPSPFYYEDQVTYLQYGNRKSINSDSVSIAKIIELISQKYNQRIMVLFTARNSLTGVYNELKKSSIGKDIPIFAQIFNSSRQSLIDGMKRTPNGVLLGTSAFWEGVDLPGDLLQILIITKLPFDVPTEPTIRAYSEMLEMSGDNSFISFAVPESVIRFRQGFGRLIRTMTDEGIFIVLDDRIVTKRYGTNFSEAIPVQMQVFTDINELE